MVLGGWSGGLHNDTNFTYTAQVGGDHICVISVSIVLRIAFVSLVVCCALLPRALWRTTSLQSHDGGTSSSSCTRSGIHHCIFCACGRIVGPSGRVIAHCHNIRTGTASSSGRVRRFHLAHDAKRQLPSWPRYDRRNRK